MSKHIMVKDLDLQAWQTLVPRRSFLNMIAASQQTRFPWRAWGTRSAWRGPPITSFRIHLSSILYPLETSISRWWKSGRNTWWLRWFPFFILPPWWSVLQFSLDPVTGQMADPTVSVHGGTWLILENHRLGFGPCWTEAGTAQWDGARHCHQGRAQASGSATSSEV